MSKDSGIKGIAEAETDDELVRRCLQDAIRLLREVVVTEFAISDEVKANLAIRIAGLLFEKRSQSK